MYAGADRVQVAERPQAWGAPPRWWSATRPTCFCGRRASRSYCAW